MIRSRFIGKAGDRKERVDVERTGVRNGFIGICNAVTIAVGGKPLIVN
ncbi:hypothetical protein P4E94_04715 [Pontiellaceae bacterium B12219]|nr:hypothetical protein [Pontiellaceae bacterium B12219]